MKVIRVETLILIIIYVPVGFLWALNMSNVTTLSSFKNATFVNVLIKRLNYNNISTVVLIYL